jgi:hypothetical protein
VGGWYVVYATPVNEHVIIYADAPGATPIPNFVALSLDTLATPVAESIASH